MTRKIEPLASYISAGDAAAILSKKLGRPIDPDYVKKLKNVRFVKINSRCKLYHKEDVQNASIRKRENKHDQE